MQVVFDDGEGDDEAASDDEHPWLGYGPSYEAEMLASSWVSPDPASESSIIPYNEDLSLFLNPSLWRLLTMTSFRYGTWLLLGLQNISLFFFTPFTIADGLQVAK